MYRVDHDFSDETMLQAVMYCGKFLLSTNGREAVAIWFNENPKADCPSTKFPYKQPGKEAPNYLESLRSICRDDSPKYADLCRRMIFSKFKNIPLVGSKDNIMSYNTAEYSLGVPDKHNVLSEYANEPVSKVKLIHGKVAKDVSEQDLMGYMFQAKQKIEYLMPLKGDSAYVAQEISKLEKAVREYAKELDSRV